MPSLPTTRTPRRSPIACCSWPTATGRIDAIAVSAARGTSAAELVRALRPLLPAGLQVADSAAQAKADAAELDDSMSILKYFLLGFGGISLLVGAFVIFNTLSITVAQRTREFATLRTLGGSRRQVMRTVVLEGAVIGLLASVLAPTPSAIPAGRRPRPRRW